MKTTHRRRSKTAWAGLSMVLLLAGGAFVYWTLNRKTDAYLTDEVAHSFDADKADLSGPKVSGTQTQAPAAPASSLTPILAGKSSAAAPAKSWGDSPIVRDLVAAPVMYLAKKTLLRSPEALEGFLSDRQRVFRYLSHPLIRGVLDDPKLTKWIAANPAMVQGFLSSPAMQDKKAVAMLAKSDLLKGVSRSAGVRALTQDPEFVGLVLANQQSITWMMNNPAAADAIRELMPALAKAVGTTRR